jgi:hypothetical protein
LSENLSKSQPQLSTDEEAEQWTAEVSEKEQEESPEKEEEEEWLRRASFRGWLAFISLNSFQVLG